MKDYPFTKGFHQIGNGIYAYLQPDGSWGLSNSGLIVDSNSSMLVDTLFDLKLTNEMLQSMSRIKAKKDIDILVNTHANGDHTFGNQLVAGATIISSKSCADEMAKQDPSAFAKLVMEGAASGEGGRFLNEVMGPSKFDFNGIALQLPTQTFEHNLTVFVGHKEVRLVKVGPAHTQGDVLVFLPNEHILFTGDIIFNAIHPIIWTGPISNWIYACDIALSWKPEVVVPGHGSLTDVSGIQEMKSYLTYIEEETRKRFNAGLSLEQTAAELFQGNFQSWLDAERLIVNVYSLYQEYNKSPKNNTHLDLYGIMAKFKNHIHGKVTT